MSDFEKKREINALNVLPAAIQKIAISKLSNINYINIKIQIYHLIKN